MIFPQKRIAIRYLPRNGDFHGFPVARARKMGWVFQEEEEFEEVSICEKCKEARRVSEFSHRKLTI